MKSRLVTLFLTIISIAISFSVQAQENNTGHNIEVTIKGLQNEQLFLGFHYGQKQFIQDTIQTDEKGHGVFQGKDKLQQGIYLVITPAKKYFEILIGKDQHFSIQTNINDFVNSMKIEGSEINQAFNEYQTYMMKQTQQSRRLQKQLRSQKENSEAAKAAQNELEQLDQQVKEKWNSLIETYPNTILAAIIKAMKTPEIPETKIPENASNPDSLKWANRYHYYRDHYFDNIDLSDERLVRTPILRNKLKHYFDNILIQQPDSIIPHADRLIAQAKPNEETFEYITRFLINHYQQSNIMGMDKVFVHLAEKYYLSGEADWIDSASLASLRERVRKIKPNLIGQIAPDLKLPKISGEYTRLHDVESDFIILYFWEPDCGHCKKTTPKIWDLYQQYDRNTLEVFAVYTQNDKQEWIKYINEKGFDWINAYDPYRSSNFRQKYDIYSTPTIYLLNDKKEIIAKRINHESLKRMLEQETGKSE